MHIEFNKVTWYSKLGALIVFIVVLPAITFYFGMEYKEIVMLNRSDYLNLTYNIDGEDIRLVNGKSGLTHIFGEPVMADINNDNIKDAVFYIVHETSGTGVFYFVGSAIAVDGGYKATNTVFIGDRISPQNINVDGKGIINVNYVTRREDEPFSAQPSVGVTKNLIFSRGNLIETVTVE